MRARLEGAYVYIYTLTRTTYDIDAMESEAKWYHEQPSVSEDALDPLRSLCDFINSLSLGAAEAARCACPGASTLADSELHRRRVRSEERATEPLGLGPSAKLAMRSCIERKRRTSDSRWRKGRRRTTAEGASVDGCMSVGHVCVPGACPPDAVRMRAKLKEAGFLCLASQPTFRHRAADYVARLDLLCVCPATKTLEVVECKLGHRSSSHRQCAEVQALLQLAALEESLKVHGAGGCMGDFSVGNAWVLICNSYRKSIRSTLTPASAAAQLQCRELLRLRMNKITI